MLQIYNFLYVINTQKRTKKHFHRKKSSSNTKNIHFFTFFVFARSKPLSVKKREGEPQEEAAPASRSGRRAEKVFFPFK